MASYKDSDPSGIYKFVNTINGKVYVGCSNHLVHRHRQHIRALRSRTHVNRYLQAAFNLYGESAFEWSIIEFCPIDQLHSREKHWIRHYSSFGDGYNLTEGGEGTYGRRWTTAQHELYQRPVVCLNTMESYDSVKEAARIGGGSGDSSIIRVCTGRAFYSGIRNGERLVWRYAKDIDGVPEHELKKIVIEAQRFRPRTRNCQVVSFPDEKIFDSETEAASHYGIRATSVNGILKGRLLTSTAQDGDRVTFRSLSDYLGMSETEKEDVRELTISGFRGNQGTLKRRKVVMFPGRHIFDSLTIAGQTTGAQSSSISISCASPLREKKKTRLSDGTWATWVYYEDYLLMSQEDCEKLSSATSCRNGHKPTNRRKVRLINTGKVFNTIREAAAECGISATSIGMACRGETSFGGKNKNGEKLFWEYVA